eukprot:49396-Rhodomonas_salina.1
MDGVVKHGWGCERLVGAVGRAEPDLPGGATQAQAHRDPVRQCPLLGPNGPALDSESMGRGQARHPYSYHAISSRAPVRWRQIELQSIHLDGWRENASRDRSEQESIDTPISAASLVRSPMALEPQEAYIQT